MTRRIVELVVDADHDVQGALVLDRRGDDHLLNAALEIGLELLGLQELAGALQHDIAACHRPSRIHPERRPR